MKRFALVLTVVSALAVFGTASANAADNHYGYGYGGRTSFAHGYAGYGHFRQHGYVGHGYVARSYGQESLSMATPGIATPYLPMAATAIIGLMATVAVFASRRRTLGCGSGTEVSNPVIRRDEGWPGLAVCE